MEPTKDKIIRKLKELYVKNIECLPYVHWFNPLITLYLNFRSFPFNQAIKLPVFVFGWPSLFSLYGKMECVGKCKMGMISLNATNMGNPQLSCSNAAINNWGKILFRGKCQILSSKINVYDGGVLEIGDDTKIFHFVNVTVSTSLFIGDHTRIAHRSQILDTNYHYIADLNKKRVSRMAHPIVIGDYCWICNSTTITGGAVIPNKTIVASNSLVNKDLSDLPENSIIGGMPAKFLKNGYRRIESMKLQRAVSVYFSENPEEKYYTLMADEDGSSCNVD